jgi:hypothetical protein
MARPMVAAQTSMPVCANCGVDISWRPRIHRGQPYCCGGCAQGGPCYCSYDLATISRRRRPRMRRLRRPVWRGAGRTIGDDQTGL